MNSLFFGGVLYGGVAGEGEERALAGAAIAVSEGIIINTIAAQAEEE